MLGLLGIGKEYIIIGILVLAIVFLSRKNGKVAKQLERSVARLAAYGEKRKVQSNVENSDDDDLVSGVLPR